MDKRVRLADAIKRSLPTKMAQWKFSFNGEINFQVENGDSRCIVDMDDISDINGHEYRNCIHMVGLFASHFTIKATIATNSSSMFNSMFKMFVEIRHGHRTRATASAEWPHIITSISRVLSEGVYQYIYQHRCPLFLTTSPGTDSNVMNDCINMIYNVEETTILPSPFYHKDTPHITDQEFVGVYSYDSENEIFVEAFSPDLDNVWLLFDVELSEYHNREQTSIAINGDRYYVVYRKAGPIVACLNDPWVGRSIVLTKGDQRLLARVVSEILGGKTWAS